VASLAETASLEGIEGVVEGSAFVRLFEAVDWLLASQTKNGRPTISARVKNTLFDMAFLLEKMYQFLLNQKNYPFNQPSISREG
jgi:hypothetical protein